MLISKWCATLKSLNWGSFERRYIDTVDPECERGVRVSSGSGRRCRAASIHFPACDRTSFIVSALSGVSRVAGPEMPTAPTNAASTPKTGVARAAAWGSATPEVYRTTPSLAACPFAGPDAYRRSTRAIAESSIGRTSPGCTRMRIGFAPSTRNKQSRYFSVGNVKCCSLSTIDSKLL